MKKALPILLAALALVGCSDDKQYHRSRHAAAAKADQRRYVDLESRFMRAAEQGKLSASFKAEDGVDEFEAWLVARTYVLKDIGACIDVGLPARCGGDWMIPVFVGREGNEDHPIVIDASTGRTSREGDLSLDYPKDFILNFEAQFLKTPNKAPEPTTGAVTPRATEGVSE